MRLWRGVLALMIVAGIEVRSAAAAVASEDVPVRGGTAAVAAEFGIDPVPDRARFIAELGRLIYGSTDRKPISALAVAAQLRALAASPTRELIPVPLTAAIWSRAVFKRTVAPDDLVSAILGDRQAAFLCHGLAGLDDETLGYLTEHPDVLTQIYQFAAEPFAVFSSTVRIRDARVVPPGGDDAAPLWEALVGQPVMRPDRFLPALFVQNDGRFAFLYDTIAQLDRPRQRFALGLWLPDRAARLAAMQSLSAAMLVTDWRAMKTQPFLRQAYDLAAALTRVSVDATGRPQAPAGRGFWSRALESPDLPEDSARLLQSAVDDRPIDAAWLAGLTTPGDIRLRAERLDQFAFGQRVFAGAPAAATADVLVATRAFRRYRMLMSTLERIGVRSPALYAQGARVAVRLASLDAARAFVATAQFQGALAIVWRMRSVGTLDVGQSETLVAGLFAVPVGPGPQYSGGMLRWIATDLRRALPPGPSLDAAIIAAVSGPPSQAAQRIEWEGQRYRFDLGASERQRIERVRERQGGATLDLALKLLAAPGPAAPSAPASFDQARSEVRSALSELSSRLGDAESDDFPAGVVPPPSPRNSLARLATDLERATAAPSSRTDRVSVELVDVAEQVAAQALVSLVYALELNDLESATLLPRDVSRRHDFGFGQKDTIQRLRAAWMLPRQDVSPGVPWHVDGSLLGLDVAMAMTSLRRLNTDRDVVAPAVTSNERETFATSVALMNAAALTDRARDVIAASIQRGDERISALKTPESVDVVADELNMDGWRRRAIRWSVMNDPRAVTPMFALHELLALGKPPADVDLNPWGMAATTSTGCLCVVMPPPGQLPLLSGRRQIGLLATGLPDLNLHVARTLSLLRLPAGLAKYVLSAAVLDYMDEVRATDGVDWLSLVRGAAAVPREQIEDYVAAAAADGPLVPDAAN